MKIVHFSNKPAYPRIDGGTIAISQLLKGLITNPAFHVTHFTLSTQKHPFKEESYPNALRKDALRNFTIDTSLKFSGALTSLVKNESYHVSRFFDSKVAVEIDNYLSEHTFDFVILESIYLLPYTELFQKKNVKVIVRTHNIEHHIWEQQAENYLLSLKKIYLRKLAKQLKKYELTALKKVDGIMAISEEDAKFMKSSFPDVPITIIPTSFSIESIENNYQLTSFYFLGAMDWLPNKEGVEWLKTRVLPIVSASVEVHLAGKNLTCEQKDDRLICHGEIENATDFIHSHGICLIPIQSGSGIKIKLLENMALGKPIITTSEGARGMQVEHNKHVIIADTPNEFAKAMILLQNDENKRIQLGKAARTFVIDNFGEEKISNHIFEFITSI
jgi:glycosyltransferase involved in cell wall biosynthesis